MILLKWNIYVLGSAEHLHSSVGTHHTSSAPQSIRRAEHAHNPGNLTGKCRPPTSHLLLDQLSLLRGYAVHCIRVCLVKLAPGSVILESLDIGPEVLASLEIHIANDRARVHSVHGGAVRQLACPGASHGLERSLGSTIHRLADETERGRDAGNIDDATAAVHWEEWSTALGQQQRGEDIDRVVPVEVVGRNGALGRVVQVPVCRDTGIVDENVDLQFTSHGEVLVGSRENGLRRFFGLAQIRLDAGAFDAVGGR